MDFGTLRMLIKLFSQSQMVTKISQNMNLRIYIDLDHNLTNESVIGVASLIVPFSRRLEVDDGAVLISAVIVGFVLGPIIRWNRTTVSPRPFTLVTRIGCSNPEIAIFHVERGEVFVDCGVIDFDEFSAFLMTNQRRVRPSSFLNVET